MTKLFISHASEDKDDIARLLADELRKDFDVWFDEYVLNVGDSLREKIDEGLRTCDFGIVILSKAFFQKRWPQNELDGLLSLEVIRGKLILPVWHNVTLADVVNFSPTLAGRLGASSENGVRVVADKLKAAITSSQRTREITNQSEGKKRLRNLFTTTAQDKYEQGFLSSEAGAQAVLKAVEDLFSTIENEIQTVSTESGSSIFALRRTPGAPGSVSVWGPHSVRGSIDIHEIYRSSAYRARLMMDFAKGVRFINQPRDGERTIYRPRCRENGRVTWQREDEKELLLTTEDLASKFIEELVKIVEECRE